MAIRITKDNFEEKVINSKLPVLVDFYSDSCVACKKLSPVIGDIEDEYEDKLNVYKVNTNYDSELSDEYNIMSNPTVVLFVQGQSVDRKVGAKEYDELSSWIDENI